LKPANLESGQFGIFRPLTVEQMLLVLILNGAEFEVRISLLLSGCLPPLGRCAGGGLHPPTVMATQ
jgi:hypothetical protein